MKRRSWRPVNLTILPFCSAVHRKLIFKLKLLFSPQLQCSNRADRDVLYKDIHEVRRNTSSSVAAGKRTNSHCCNVDGFKGCSLYLHM